MKKNNVWNRLLLKSEEGSLLHLFWYFCAQLLVMLAACTLLYANDFEIPIFNLSIILIAQSLLTIGAALLSHSKMAATFNSDTVLLLISIFLLGCFLQQTGGHTNPVISLLLVPLAISAALLSVKSTALIAIFVLILYSTLTQFFIPLQQANQHNHHFMQLHLMGMWFTFALSVFLIVGLVLPMAQSMRKKQNLIVQQHEQALQNEKLIAIATFAASAAHRLGTPLSTLAILADDMTQYAHNQKDWQEDLELMTQQIRICKNTMQELMKSADSLHCNTPELTDLVELVARLRDQFNLLHPSLSLRIETDPIPMARITCDATLDQALLNLLDNSAKASQSNPCMSIIVDEKQVCLRLQDTGPGIPEIINQQLGKPFISSREDGIGIGLFLSHATIARMGGALKLIPTAEGTLAEIWLPITEHYES